MCFPIFSWLFEGIPDNVWWHSRNVWGHSLECLMTFYGILWHFPEYLRYSPEYLVTFPWMFGNILRNVYRFSPNSLVTFPGIFESIPRNIRFRNSPSSVSRSCIPGFILVICFGNTIAEKITKAAAKSTRKDKKLRTNTANNKPTLRKYTYHQKSGSRFLMNFNYCKCMWNIAFSLW